ncbi:MAG: prepilin-type N-terminal cleavage/methylation domain-containing protein [Phycisphaerae bacterium]|nr:prepilin-type N-terminal cleavage/methylation domain-containing protein [Phycisphaerae bacterium]
MTTRRHNPPARGLTLVELVISMTLMTLLTTGIVSAVVLASRAMPPSGIASQTGDAATVAADLAAELSCAQSFTERTATAVTFAVPDRTGDGSPEIVRYSWAGTGSPLVRVFNGTTTANVLNRVNDFSLDFESETVTQPGRTSLVESDETILAYHDMGSGQSRTYTVQEDAWVGQYFEPTLPGNAVSWSITSVTLVVESYLSATGGTWVQIRRANASALPTSNVLAQVLMPESSLSSSMSPYRVDFDGLDSLLPSDRVCLVLQFESGTASCEVQLEQLGDNESAGCLVSTNNAGQAWFPTPSRDMVYRIRGRYKSNEPIQVLRRVRISLRTTAEESSRIETAAAILNEPEWTAP